MSDCKHTNTRPCTDWADIGWARCLDCGATVPDGALRAARTDGTPALRFASDGSDTGLVHTQHECWEYVRGGILLWTAHTKDEAIQKLAETAIDLERQLAEERRR